MNGSSKIFAITLMGSLLGLSGCNNHNGDLGAADHAPVLKSEPLPAADVVVVPEAKLEVKNDIATVAKPKNKEIVQAQYVSTRSNETAVNAAIETPAAPVEAVSGTEKAVVPADLQVLLDQWQKLPEGSKSQILTIIKSANK